MLAALCLATGAVCFTRYRSTGDTHPFFVCAGLLAVAWADHPVRPAHVPVGPQLPVGRTELPRARVVRRMARGRRRPSCSHVRGGIAGDANPSARRSSSSATFGLLLVIDLVLIVYRHSLPRARNIDLRTHAAFSLTSPLLWIFGGATIVLLSIAAWREWKAGGDVRSTPPVARRRVGDRGRRAVRPAGPAHPLPSPAPAGRRLAPALRRGGTPGIPCTATCRGLPGSSRHRPRTGGDGRSRRDRSDDLPRGARSRQHDPRTRRARRSPTTTD